MRILLNKSLLTGIAGMVLASSGALAGSFPSENNYILRQDQKYPIENPEYSISNYGIPSKGSDELNEMMNSYFSNNYKRL